MKDVLAASKSGAWTQNPDGTVTVAGQVLSGEDFTLRLRVPEGLAAHSLRGEGAVILNVVVTQALKDEGLARDLVRLVQMTRKEAGLHISDRIELGIATPPEFSAAIESHRKFICEETLALALKPTVDGKDEFRLEHELEGKAITIGVRRVAA